MRTLLKAAALAAVTSALFIGVALAQATATTTNVTIPWGDVLGQIGADLLPWAGLALLTVITGLLPAPVRAIVQKFRTQQVDQLLERALGFAASKLQTSIKGQALTVDLHNQLVAQAAQYAIDHGAKAVLDYAGSVPVLEQKLAARVLTSPAVQAAQGSISPAFPSAAAK